MPLTLTRPASREHLTRFLFEDLTRAPPRRGEEGLEHARRFARILGDPQDHARQVHLVGTAGKGTAAATLTDVVVESGVGVATHLSPHVYDVRERFLLDGSVASWEDVLAAADEIFRAATRLHDESGRPPSFFAAAAGLAWVLGRRAGVDLMITEAGIGGRFDATNVIRRSDKITVVTNVGLDHVDVLGPDLGSIARQKAEVMTPEGVVIVGPQTHPLVVEVVADTARDRDTRLVVVDQSSTDWRVAAVAIADAVAAELEIEIRSGSQPRLPPGRGEIRQLEGRTVVLDGAHNPLKLAALFAGLEADRVIAAGGALVLVAIGAGKDLAGCAQVIARHVTRAVVTSYGDPADPEAHPRSWPTATVADALSDCGVEVLGEAPEPATATDLVVGSSSPGQTIVVTGSFFHLAPVRDRLLARAGSGT